MIRFSYQALAAALLASLTLAAAAQETAATNRSTELKSAPAYDAATITTLPLNTALQVVGRKSGWTQVSAGTQTGWIRAFHVRFQATVAESTESSSGGFGSMLGGLFGGSKRAAPRQTATIGIRGLTTEELQTASPNPQAFEKMQTLRADASSAERLAREGKLAPVKVDYVSGDVEAAKGGRQ